MDRVPLLLRSGEAGAAQSVHQEPEADLHPFEPGGVYRGEVEVDVLVAGQPAVVSKLVGSRLRRWRCAIVGSRLPAHHHSKCSVTDLNLS